MLVHYYYLVQKNSNLLYAYKTVVYGKNGEVEKSERKKIYGRVNGEKVIKKDGYYF